MFKKLAFLTGILALVISVSIQEARAHPHAWVDTTVKILFGPSGEVLGLRQTWLFDDFYSMFVVEGADFNRDGKPDQEALDAVMTENLKNLREYNYFTEIKSGETVLAMGSALDAETRMVETRLELVFTVLLEQPVSPRDIPVSYMIFDPTYYVEMLHPEKGPGFELIDAPSGCEADLLRPNPNEDEVLYAASLGQNESGGNTLGRIFAEEVRVTCN